MSSDHSQCIFCGIVNKQTDTELLYEDEEICVFRDIKPASRFHILTVPKRHIEDVKSLQSSDKELVAHMLRTAQDLITKHNLSVEDSRFGYHWPPFRSVKHLHLHAIAPESEMGFVSRLIFKKDSYWFVSTSLHLVVECPAYSAAKREIMGSDTLVEHDLKDLTIGHLLKFCKATGSLTMLFRDWDEKTC